MIRALQWLGIGLVLLFIGFVALSRTPDEDRAVLRARYGGAPSQFVDMGGGLVVHLRDQGPRDAPVIVLLHGAHSTLNAFEGWARALQPQWRVIRFDLAGHGLTGPDPAGDYSDSAHAALVDRVTARLGVTRFVLAGSSMGGGVAWRYAHQHPEKLAGLVLVNSTGEPDGTSGSPPLIFRVARMPVVRYVFVRLTPRSLVEDGLRQAVADPALVTPTLVDRYWDLLRYPGNRAAAVARNGSPASPPVSGALPVPALILWGAEDRLIPAASARWFARQLPASQTIIYPGVGHLVMEEIPGPSARDLKAWLAKLPPPR